MKQIIWIVVILLLVSSVLAMYGGESTTIYQDDCSIAYVNITGTEIIDQGEFTLSDNCIFDSEWIYNCTCEKPITLITKLNTKNIYKITTDIWKEREEEPKENIETTVTNPTEDNITNTITFPNNIKIDRIIQPNEVLEYTEIPSGEIILPESNVTLNKVEKVSGILEINATSSGDKCFDVYSENQPYKIYVDDNEIEKTFDSKVIHFCTAFSTRIIKLNYNFPAETSTSSSSSGGRGGGTRIGVTPAKKDNIPPTIGNITITEPQGGGGSEVKEPVKQGMSNGMIGFIIVLVIVVVIVVLYYIFKKEDEEQSEIREEQKDEED